MHFLLAYFFVAWLELRPSHLSLSSPILKTCIMYNNPHTKKKKQQQQQQQQQQLVDRVDEEGKDKTEMFGHGHSSMEWPHKGM